MLATAMSPADNKAASPFLKYCAQSDVLSLLEERVTVAKSHI